MAKSNMPLSTPPAPALRRGPIAAQAARRGPVGMPQATGWLLVLPAILYLLVWTVYPLIYAVYVSLTNLNLTRPATGRFIGLTNYALILQDSTFWTAIANTLQITILSIAGELVLGYLVAKLFVAVQGMPGVGTMRSILTLPIMITPLFAGLLWSYNLNPTLGIVNYLLGLLKLPIVDWFGNTSLALYTVILINTWQWLPFTMLLIVAGLTGIPKDLQEVALLDGASWWDRFTKLEFPFILHVVSLGIFIRVMENLKMFDLVYATTRGGPGTATEVASLLAYRSSFLYYQTGYGAAIALLILIISNIVVQVLHKYLWAPEVV